MIQRIAFLAVISCVTLFNQSLVAQPTSSTSTKVDDKRNSNQDPIAEINVLVEKNWEAYGLKPSPNATDNEWVRRLFLDLIGRIPTVEELNEFLNDKSQDKRERLVERLMNDDRYVEDFARNWTTIWSNLLIGRTGGNNRRSMVSREGMNKYLRDSFARGKPYDKMVYELITATGTARPGSDKFNGAVNFLIDKVNEENGAQATAKTSQIFLGLQVQCTQCHNHPFNDWKQQKYWEMNAFFRQTRALRLRQSADGLVGELVDQDYAGESRKPKKADLFYELRNGLVKVAFPVFVDGTAINPSGYLDEVNRRKELGKMIVKSPYMDKAIVNRMWSHFLGYGFTKPIDDFGPHNNPSNPALLDYLAKTFKQYRYDMRELMRWIVLSRPYALSSRMTKNNKKDDPQLGEPARFSHFYLRQMRAEELYESLVAATKAVGNRGSYAEQERKKNMWLQQFSQAFGTDEGDETTTFNGTIPQTLMMFNGDLIKNATGKGKGTLLDDVVNDKKMSLPRKVDHLFLAGLSRKASRSEFKLAQQLIKARGGSTAEGLRDMWWVILNSNEFIFNH